MMRPAPSAALTWDLVGGPPVGTVFAVALTAGPEPMAFAAASTGLYAARPGAGRGWESLPGISGAATAVAVSPDFAEDHTLLLGTPQGIYVSYDAGATWLQSRLPRASAHIQALGVSPNFAQDGLAFAGTLEDGVFCSTDRGQNWFAWNFRLLDASVLCLAVSPNFAKDQTVFAGTASALYRSTNEGRAWRELSLPSPEPTVLCLALSPNFVNDGRLLVGTESDGLFVSDDRGQNWEAVDLGTQADCIDALAFAGDMPLAALADGIYGSADGGSGWQRLVEQDQILCLAAQNGLGLAGLAGQEPA